MRDQLAGLDDLDGLVGCDPVRIISPDGIWRAGAPFDPGRVLAVFAAATEEALARRIAGPA